MTRDDSASQDKGNSPKPVASGLVGTVSAPVDENGVPSLPLPAGDQIAINAPRKSIATRLEEEPAEGNSRGNHVASALIELKRLVTEVVHFLYDLYPEKVKIRMDHQVRFAFAADEPDDWIFMPVPDEGVMLFNANLLLTGAASHELFKAIVVHELCHYFLQDMHSKKQVKKLKMGFGSLAVEQTDVLADVIAYDYLRLKRGLDKISAFELIRESIALFRHSKCDDLEYIANNTRRDIGTALSVAALYENDRISPGNYSYCIVSRIFERQVDLQQVQLVPTGSPVTLRSGYAIETEITASVVGANEKGAGREFYVQHLGPHGVFWSKLVLSHQQLEFISQLYVPGDEYRPCDSTARAFAELAVDAAKQVGLISNS